MIKAWYIIGSSLKQPILNNYIQPVKSKNRSKVEPGLS